MLLLLLLLVVVVVLLYVYIYTPLSPAIASPVTTGRGEGLRNSNINSYSHGTSIIIKVREGYIPT